MNHLGVLEQAGLLLVARRVPERQHSLNAVPLRQMHQRWVSTRTISGQHRAGDRCIGDRTSRRKNAQDDGYPDGEQHQRLAGTPHCRRPGDLVHGLDNAGRRLAPASVLSLRRRRRGSPGAPSWRHARRILERRVCRLGTVSVLVPDSTRTLLGTRACPAPSPAGSRSA